MNNQNPDNSTRLSFFSVIRSILAAGIGVQSNKNRENDFKHGKPLHFAIAGIIGTLLFLMMIWGLVQLALSSAS